MFQNGLENQCEMEDSGRALRLLAAPKPHPEHSRASMDGKHGPV